MKRVFLAILLCADFASAQNITKPALFITRVNVLPSKAATLGAFQILYAGVAFIPAAFVALAVKRHAGPVGEASAELTFATVGGAILAASAGVTLAQAWSNFAEATASSIWNPDEVVVVKAPIAVTQSP